MKQKKRNTTKRLSKTKLANLKKAIRAGDSTSNIAKGFGVTGSTVAYHRGQMKKSDKLDREIDAQEETRTLEDVVSPREVKEGQPTAFSELQTRLYALMKDLNGVSRERDLATARVRQLEALLVDQMIKQKNQSN